MITFAREHLYEMSSEVDELLELHYQELTLNKDRVKLAPRWDQYRALQEMGAFTVHTARDEGTLVGYSAFFVNAHMHYEAMIHAHNDVIFLHPAHRRGLTGIRLIKFSEVELKVLDIHKITYHAKLDTALIRILHRHGYTTEEMVLGKFI